MATTSVNAGAPLRWENAGLIRIFNTAGTDDYSPLLIIPGSLEFKPGRTEPIPVMDRGQYTRVKDGDERLSTLKFKVRPTKTGLSTGSAELIAVLLPANSSAGERSLFSVTVQIPDARGGSTGTRMTLDNCYLNEGESFKAGAGQNVDELEIVLNSTDPTPLYAAY